MTFQYFISFDLMVYSEKVVMFIHTFYAQVSSWRLVVYD